MAEQSDPFFAPADLLTMTPTSSVKIPAQEHQLQKHKERVENLSQPDQLIKVCTDARFLKKVEIGQYFMTKHTDEFLQFAEPATYREYAFQRDDKSTDPKAWIQGNTKIGPVLEVTTSYLQSKHVVEIRIESVNIDNSEFLMDWTSWSQTWSTKSTTTTSRETSTTKTEAFVIASGSKAKKQHWADLQLLAHLQGLYLFSKEHGLILNQELRSIKLAQCQKEWTHFFDTENFFEKKMERSNSGDWRKIFGTDFGICNIGLMMYGRTRWKEAEVRRIDFNTVLTH